MKIAAQRQLASLKQNIGRKGVAFTLIELLVVIAIRVERGRGSRPGRESRLPSRAAFGKGIPSPRQGLVYLRMPLP
jgi:hypothetical protein